MKATCAKEITIRLELNYDEAAWLRDVMQNYTGPGEESDRNQDMRRAFFDGVNSALKKGA